MWWAGIGGALRGAGGRAKARDYHGDVPDDGPLGTFLQLHDQSVFVPKLENAARACCGAIVRWHIHIMLACMSYCFQTFNFASFTCSTIQKTWAIFATSISPSLGGVAIRSCSSRNLRQCMRCPWCTRACASLDSACTMARAGIAHILGWSFVTSRNHAQCYRFGCGVHGAKNSSTHPKPIGGVTSMKMPCGTWIPVVQLGVLYQPGMIATAGSKPSVVTVLVESMRLRSLLHTKQNISTYFRIEGP